MREMLPVQEAQQLVLSRIEPLPKEEVSLLDASDRVLGMEVTANDSMPPFNRSAMDGYAIRSADAGEAESCALRVLEELPAGKVALNTVEPGTCIMLMTGAPMPRGADTVIKREDVIRQNDRITFTGPVRKGNHVDPMGSDISFGEVLIRPGSVIGPGEIAVLASQGYPWVKVYRRPKVAIITSGDELLEVEQPLAGGKIRNSNRYMLAAAVKKVGGEPLICPNMADDLELTKQMLQKAGAEADLVLTTGGVSMGDYDLVRIALTEIADEVLFWKIRAKPGKPVVAARKNNTVFLGLSGNPTGALLNFYLLAQPAIDKLSGKAIRTSRVEATLQNEFHKPSHDRTRYLWAKADYNNGWKVSHYNDKKLMSMQGFNALVEVPAGSRPLHSGELVNTILL